MHITHVAIGLVLASATACQREHASAKDPVATSSTGAATGSSASGSGDPWTKPSAAADPLPRPLLWAIEKDGTTSYLFGTIHVGVDPASRLPALVIGRLEQSRAFAMETDLSDASLTDLRRKDGGSLHDDLGPEYWERLSHVLEPAIARRVDRMRPMVAATILSMRGLPPTPAMDSFLLAHATGAHKPVTYLEPASAELAVLDKWLDVRALHDLLDDLPRQEQHTKDMLAAYIGGDEQKLIDVATAERDEWKRHGRSDAEFEQATQDLLYRRNASWIAELEQLHAQGGAFVAVGAMHLVGTGSVTDLLQRRGFKVSRVTQ